MTEIYQPVIFYYIDLRSSSKRKRSFNSPLVGWIFGDKLYYFPCANAIKMYIFAWAQQILRNMNLKLIALTKTALVHVFKSIKKKISTSQTQRKKRISLSIINHLFIYSFSLHLSVFKAFEIISNIGLSAKAIQNPFSTSCKSI